MPRKQCSKPSTKHTESVSSSNLTRQQKQSITDLCDTFFLSGVKSHKPTNIQTEAETYALLCLVEEFGFCVSEKDAIKLKPWKE